MKCICEAHYSKWYLFTIWLCAHSCHVHTQSCVCTLSCLTLCDPIAPLSMEFSRQEYWCGLPFPSPEHLPEPGIELVSLATPALVGKFFNHWTTRETHNLAVSGPSCNVLASLVAKCGFLSGCGRWNLNSLISSLIHIPRIGRKILQYWTTKKSRKWFIWCKFLS